MGKKASIAKYISVNAGEEKDVLLYTVDDAHRFNVESLSIIFPSGVNAELEVSLLHGIKQFAPYVGKYQGDGYTIDDVSNEVLDSGERILVHVKNTNTSSAHSVFVIVRGELVLTG